LNWLKTTCRQADFSTKCREGRLRTDFHSIDAVYDGWQNLLEFAMQPGTLHFISGRLASGKTTLARKLAAEHHAVFFCEDVWLSKLSDGISSFDEYLNWSRRCRSVMGPLIVDTLRAGASVVLDFAGNTIAERAWVRGLFEQAGSPHHLHFLDVSEDECLHRLLGRNVSKPEGLYFASTTEEEFRSICKWFQAPHPDEGLVFTTY
jgi:predicted kinase